MFVKPDFYDKFRCIASECDFTCCQEWKIGVDEETNRKWKGMKPPRGVASRRKNMSLFTMFKDKSRVIALDRNHQCPFLDENRLCRVVCSYGEENISQTCHVFPREVHHFEKRTEYTLMPCCPAVLDLLNGSPSFSLLSDRTPDDLAREADDGKAVPPAFGCRDFLMNLMLEPDESPAALLTAAFFLLNLQAEKENPGMNYSPKDMAELFSGLRNIPIDPMEHFAECNELFLDLIENYRKEGLYPQFLNEAARQAEELEETQDAFYDKEFYQTWSSYRNLMKKFLAEEVFAELLIPDSLEYTGEDSKTMESRTGRLQKFNENPDANADERDSAEKAVEPDEKAGERDNGEKAVEPDKKAGERDNGEKAVEPDKKAGERDKGEKNGKSGERYNVENNGESGKGRDRISDEEFDPEILEHMMVKLQWIALEYSVIRHMAWLLIQKGEKLTYEKLRSLIVLVSRMMGYEDDDIYEYLENSFEDVTWEIGYFVLTVGKEA